MHANFRAIIQRKMQILSSFTQLHVFSNLYDLLSSVKHKIKYLKKCIIQWKSMGSKVPIRTNFGPHWLSFYAVETSFKISYIRKSYRFGKTWWWANDDRIGISGWIDLVLSLNKTCPLVWKTQNKNRKLLQWCYMGKNCMLKTTVQIYLMLWLNWVVWPQIIKHICML